MKSDTIIPQILSGIPVHQCNYLQDDQVVAFKEPPQLIMGHLAYLQTKWLAGGTIDDFIEWRCAFYSRQIDRKYYLA